MPRPKSSGLTENEMEVMKILWEESPLKVAEILERVMRKPKPAYTSLMTLVQAMTKKGYISSVQEGKAYFYSPILKQKAILADELKRISKHFFDGTTKGLVMNLVKDQKLSSKEIDELRAILGEKE
jgi:BlaI family penicillinase repressor